MTGKLPAVLLAVWLAAGVAAQDLEGEAGLPSPQELATVEIDEALEQFVARMGDPLYAVREAATAELMATSVDRLELYALLARGGLTAEQRYRVLAVVEDRLLNEPRGAVGIKVNQQKLRNDMIIIEELLPGLPAQEVLEVGDRITHLGGNELADWNQFVVEVQSRRPGDRIELTVVRLVEKARRDERAGDGPQYERLQITLELGSATKLRDPITGRQAPGGPVWERRKREADDARERWSSDPRVIRIGSIEKQ